LGGLRICRFDCILFQTFLFKLPITKWLNKSGLHLDKEAWKLPVGQN
jgi:hypothetical protein